MRVPDAAAARMPFVNLTTRRRSRTKGVLSVGNTNIEVRPSQIYERVEGIKKREVQQTLCFLHKPPRRWTKKCSHVQSALRYGGFLWLQYSEFGQEKQASPRSKHAGDAERNGIFQADQCVDERDLLEVSEIGLRDFPGDDGTALQKACPGCPGQQRDRRS
jgi:hypothetical protein